MSLNFILLAIGGLLIIAGIVVAILTKKGSSDTGEKKKSVGYAALLLLGLATLIFSQCFVIVGTGYSGVRITFGQVDEKAVSQGFNFKIPFVQTIVTVNNRQQDLEVVGSESAIESTISGKVPITISGVTVTYQINREKASYVYSTVTDPDHLVTYSIVSSAIKATTPAFDTDGVVIRSDVEGAVKDTLQEYIDNKYGADVVSVIQITVGNISFTDEYNTSVNEKNMAKQAAETQEIENKKNIDKANAEAEAKLISAQAEKEANELLEKSITNNILVQQYLDKWNGVLPTVTGSDGSVMIDISKLMEESAGSSVNEEAAAE